MPGTVASAWAWRRDFQPFEGIPLRTLLFISLAGGLVGAILLLVTPQRAFDGLLPWLLLLGALAFTFGRRVGEALRQHMRIGVGAILAAQIVLSIYAGYFGGGVGIMMMAVWSLLGQVDIKAMSAARTILVSAANVVAVSASPLRPRPLARDGDHAGGRDRRRLCRRRPGPAGAGPVLRGFVIAFSFVHDGAVLLARAGLRRLASPGHQRN